MNRSSKQRAVNGTAGPADQMQKTAPNPLAPPFTRTDRKQDPSETAQEAVHQVTPRTSVDAPAALDPAADTRKAPLRAAKGDDDLMSKPPQAKPSV